MLYYDRRLPDDLMELTKGPLGWLGDWLRGDEAKRLHARIDWRRADGGRRHGGIQVYFGRTSPLEVLGCPRQMVAFNADQQYVDLTPDLFGHRWNYGDIAGMSSALSDHLRRCSENLTPEFVQGEAVSHAGLMRRYGLFHREGDPILAMDSEVRVGFRRDGNVTGTDARTQHETELKRVVSLGTSAAIPRKLDALGVLTTGELALVEVKDEGGDLRRALAQVAAHVFTFRRLAAQNAAGLVEVINGMIEQKAEAGFVTSPRYIADLRVVPVVAAPDERPDWADAWRHAHQPSELLSGLRVWRLSAAGDVLDELTL